VKSILNILEHHHRYAEACEEATSSITILHKHGSDPRAIAQRALGLCLRHGDASAKSSLAAALYGLLEDHNHSVWAFDVLEKLCGDDGLDAGDYATSLVAALSSRRGPHHNQTRVGMILRLTKLGRPELALGSLGDEFVARAPSDPADAADYLGNGCWAAYIAGDPARCLALAELALAAAPDDYRSDWLLGNRGFALVLLDREQAAMQAYEHARAATPDAKRWQDIALADLEQHTHRHPDAAPIDARIIAAVRELGSDLPPTDATPEPTASA
jgi:tetratricopeptide (TPR) repeat protein